MQLSKLISKVVKEFKEKEFDQYYHTVVEDFRHIKAHFPLLNLTLLPTIVPMEMYISGRLIPKEMLDKCKGAYQIDKFSIEIVVVYPQEFPAKQIEVIDYKGKIQWDKVPIQHTHVNTWRDVEVLCTHHPNGEINALESEKRTTAILKTSWNLYQACGRYLRTGEWELKDLKHGSEAIPQLKDMGQYYKTAKST